MNQKAKVGLASLAAALIVSGGMLVQGTFAADSTDADPMSTLVEKIATKFNLNKADVQQVFDEQRTEMHAKHEAKHAERLAEAVANGKITTEQQKLITDKQAEIRTKMEEIRNLTDETERRAAMDALRSDTEKWATDNKIDAKWLHPGGGHRKGHHGGPGFMIKERMSDTQTN